MPPFTRSKAALAKPLPPSAANTVFQTDDVYQLILGLLNIRQLAQLRRASRLANRDVHQFLRSRVHKYTLPFFSSAELRDKFFHYLDIWKSLVVGSVPLAALSMPSNPPVPDNMNVIATFDKYFRWMHAMQYVLDFTVVYEGECGEEYARVGFRYVTFRNNTSLDKLVTITFSNRPHLWELWFSAPHPYQWNAISGRSLICPNVVATSRQVSIVGWPNRSHNMYKNIWCPSPFPGIVKVYADTSNWPGACGWLCPGLIRAAQGLEGVGHWGWGGVDGDFEQEDRLLTAFGRSQFTWKIATVCINPACSPARK
ncbi:hypothetical protein R3P38DRAFT_3190747 [Favolaschia claudopus]|uniref:F-box domain-containing protein n=1 Tax=Favolaschia claudopus TaxID=2862362 RepID=A0AAW0BLZ0_9AGAR